MTSTSPLEPLKLAEYEYLLEFIEARAISAAPLVFARDYVERLALLHAAHKVAYFGIHFVVHLLSVFKEFFHGNLTPGRTVFAVYVVVVKHNAVEPQFFFNRLFQFFNRRNYILYDVCAEFFHHFAIIIRSSHTVIAELDVIFITHLFRHTISHVNEAIVNIVELVSMFFKSVSYALRGAFSRFPVPVFEITSHDG